MKKICFVLVLILSLLAMPAFAGWNRNLLKGGIDSDGTNIIVDGNVTAMGGVKSTTALTQTVPGVTLYGNGAIVAKTGLVLVENGDPVTWLNLGDY